MEGKSGRPLTKFCVGNFMNIFAYIISVILISIQWSEIIISMVQVRRLSVRRLMSFKVPRLIREAWDWNPVHLTAKAHFHHFHVVGYC